MNSVPEYLPGYLGMYHIQEEAPSYYQGVEIVIPISLIDGETVIDYKNFNLQVILKDDLTSAYAVWIGSLGHGISVVENEVKIVIPTIVSQSLEAKIYHIAVIGVSKTNMNHSAILFASPISIKLSAASTIPASTIIVNNPIPALPTVLGEVMEIGYSP